LIQVIKMKIQSIENINSLSKGRIVLCHGCFDLFHYGHLQHLKEAKLYGDTLVVTVTSDEYVGKGINRPIFPILHRMSILSELECVDYVAISNYSNAVYAIHRIRPYCFVKGSDYIGEGIVQEEREALDTIGAKLFFTKTDKLSTTEIIEKCKRV